MYLWNALHIKCSFIKDFFGKYDLRKRKLWIQLHLLKKSIMENFIFCVVILAEFIFVTFYLHKQHESLRPQSLQPLQNRKQLQIQRPLHSILIAPLTPIHFKIYIENNIYKVFLYKLVTERYLQKEIDQHFSSFSGSSYSLFIYWGIEIFAKIYSKISW